MSEKVLVIGSNGFIGFKMVKMLAKSGFKVFCGISSNNRAFRVCTINAEKSVLDITKKINSKDLQNIDYIINCSTGNAKVIEDGTRNILEACLRNKVKKYIHLSSVDVYGGLKGDIFEDSITKPQTPYGQSKLKSENICHEYIKLGQNVTILRPAIVYGPDSELWVNRICKRSQSSEFALTEKSKQGQCNLIYIDDLVNITIEALKNDKTNNKTYNISSTEKVSWFKYYEFYNKRLSTNSDLKLKNHYTISLKLFFLDNIKKIAKFALDYFKTFILNFANSNSMIKTIFKSTEQTLSINMNSNELDLITRKSYYNSNHFKDDFAYRLKFNFDKGKIISLNWYKDYLTFLK